MDLLINAGHFTDGIVRISVVIAPFLTERIVEKIAVNGIDETIIGK